MFECYIHVFDWLYHFSPPSGSSECEWSDSGSDLRLRKFPSLLHGKRSAPELPLLPPATRRIDQASPTKRDDALTVKRKPLPKPRPSPRSPRRFSFDLATGSFGGFSEDEGWNRRRSERIFLHDATASANQMSVSTCQNSSSSSSSSVPTLTPKPASRTKPALPSREGKDVVKVRQLPKAFLFSNWEPETASFPSSLCSSSSYLLHSPSNSSSLASFLSPLTCLCVCACVWVYPSKVNISCRSIPFIISLQRCVLWLVKTRKRSWRTLLCLRARPPCAVLSQTPPRLWASAQYARANQKPRPRPERSVGWWTSWKVIIDVNLIILARTKPVQLLGRNVHTHTHFTSTRAHTHVDAHSQSQDARR